MPQSLLIPRAEVMPASADPDLPWTVMFWVAVAMTILGFADAAFVWLPFRIGEPAWRVGAIRATVDALPLPTISVAALFVASARRETTRALGVVAFVAGISFAIVMLLAAFYLASAIRVGSGSAALSQTAVIRTTFFALVYAFVYALITGAATQRLMGSSSRTS